MTRNADSGTAADPASDLASRVRSLARRHDAGEVETGDDRALETIDRFLEALERGTVRAAEPTDDTPTADSPPGRREAPDRTRNDDPGPSGRWTTNEWVKRGVLLAFALRETRGREYGDVTYHDVLGVRGESDEPLGDGVRNTPDGTVVRRGAFVGDDAILMSPSFVNVGARVGERTLVDSCVTVGSCAQVGADVKIGANSLVGGVLEPVEDAPVVIEDGVSLGSGCRVTSGFVVGRNSVVAENTLLTPRIPIYDLPTDRVLYGRLPPERRAFARYVESSLGDHDLFEGRAYKPAVVALGPDADTDTPVEREAVLRS